jgi:hypothetical protein
MPSKKPRINHENIRQRARPYSSLIYAGKNLGEAREKQLKAESRLVISYVLGNTPLRRTGLLGPLFPKNLNDLAGPLPIAASDDLVTQLNWLHAVLCHHSDSLNHFQSELLGFQNCLLVGNYDGAEAKRQAIVERNGHSWWSIESDLLISQKRRGLEGNREALQRYQKEDTSGWVKCICHLLSLRVEDGFPANDYDRYCDHIMLKDDVTEQMRKKLIYIRSRINFHKFDSLDHLSYCLSMEDSHSLIDRYCSFIRAMQFAIAFGDSATRRRIAGIATTTASFVQDPRLSVLASVLCPDRMKQTPEGDTVFSALDHYTAGRYETAAQIAQEEVIRCPGSFELYELSAHSHLRGGDSAAEFPEGSPASELLRLVSEVLSRNEDTTKSLRRLTKLAYQLDCIPIGSQIYSFVRRHESNPAKIVNTFTNYSASLPTPRMSIFTEDNESALQYLSRLQDLYPNNASIQLFWDVRQSLVACKDLIATEKLPETRVWKYRAFVFEKSARYNDALNAYKRLDQQSGVDLLLKADATAGLYRCYRRLDQVLESANILALAAALTPWLVSESSIREVLDKYRLRRDALWLSDVCWPVLHVTAHLEGYARYDPDQLHDVLDEFLTSLGFSRPTELRAIHETLPTSCLILVLRSLCTTDVLQSSVWYDSQDVVEKERIAICKWLVELDPPTGADYLREIAELTSRSNMREITHKVGQSKIFVDTTGLKESLPIPFFDRAERYLQYAALRSHLRGTLEVAEFSKEDVKRVSIVIIDGTFTLFVQLFNEVKQLFLYSNEYGLDSNLSQRIRHGTLLGAIRAPFEQLNLVTLKNADGVYLENTHWLSRLVESSHPAYATSRVALQELSFNIDSIAHEVRTRWIQIKGNTSELNGMFDYDFGDDLLREMYSRIDRLASVDALIELVLESLWKRTEENLLVVRSAITSQLKRRLSVALDQCQHSLETSVSPDKVVEFRSAVTSCKTSLEYALQSVADWFQVDQANRMPAFNLSSLIDAVLENVERYCRPSHLDVKRTINVARPIQGRLFRPLWDVFFILCDNVAKHSQLSPVPVNLNVTEQDAKIRIEIVNTLGAMIDIADIVVKASLISGRERGENQWDLLRREGGSGLTKLHKILRYEIGSEAYDFNAEVLEDRRFSVSLALPEKGIFDESPRSR